MKLRIILVGLAGGGALAWAAHAHAETRPCEARLASTMNATQLVPGEVHDIDGGQYVIRRDDSSLTRVCEHLDAMKNARAQAVNVAVREQTEKLVGQLDERKTLDYWLHKHPIYGWILAFSLGSFILAWAIKPQKK